MTSVPITIRPVPSRIRIASHTGADSPAPPLGPRPRLPRRSRRTVSGVLLLAVLLPLLSGCLRVQVTMGVSKSDRVTGHIVAATIPKSGDDRGPQLTVPKGLEDKIRVQDYRQDGYVGTEAYFRDLTFSEARDLGRMMPDHSRDFGLTFTRTGDTVTFDGRADLSNVPEGADVEVSINFPTRPATTDGTRDSDTGVTWKLPTGEQTSMHAVVNYEDPASKGLTFWVAIVSVVALAAAALAGYVAWRSRDTSPKPGQ